PGARGGAFGRIGEEADEQRADQTADQVDTYDVEAVVEAQPVLQAHREGTASAGDQADDQGAPGRDRGTRRGDRDQAGDDTGGGAERGGVPVAEPLYQEPAEHGRAGGAGVVAPAARRLRTGTEGRAGVETEPAEPEDAGA